jgi:hypothetical protein
MESEKDPKLRGHITTGFLALQHYQPGVGEPPIRLTKIDAASADDPRTPEVKALFDRETDYLRNMFKRAETVGFRRAVNEDAAKWLADLEDKK